MYASLTEDRASSAGPCANVPVDVATRLRSFIEAYWLRPENAFWMTLRSATLARYALETPMIDVSCGDGVFSFLHAGGTFAPSFDVFRAVTALDRIRDEHHDMFDCSDDDYQPEIVTFPERLIDVGSDFKPALLAKAGRLRLYERLVEHDNNSPMPFDDDSFQTVYCNSAYWVENIAGFLAELGRVTRPGGHVILHVKLDSLRKYTLEAHRGVLGDRVLDIIGRGRVECWPSLADRSTWEARFATAGLAVIEATPFVTRTHAQIWDVGLRPIAPMLVKMANALNDETRAAIKQDWVDLFCELLTPLCDPDFYLFGCPDEPAEVQYILTRKRSAICNGLLG